MKPNKERPRAGRPKTITAQTFFVPLLYYIFSVIWITTTDKIVASVASTPQEMMLLSMYKGWFYVFLTSLLISGILIIAARQRHLANIKQMETDARMRALIENSPDIIARYGKDLKYLYVSPSIVALTGIKAQNCVGRTNSELGTFPSSQQNLENQIQSVLETGVPIHAVYETKSPLGLISLDVRLIPEYGPDGSVISVLSTARDITEITQAQNALRASEERYRELVEKSQDAIAIYQDGAYVYANPASAHLLGYSDPSEINGKALGDVIAPEDLALVMEYNERLMRSQDVPSTFEVRMLRRDGSVTWVEVSASLREYNNKPAVQVAYYNIDARKKAEEALITREAMLHGIFAAAPIGIGIVRNRVVGWTNTALQEMLGYAGDELNAKSARMLYNSDKEFERVAEVKHPQVEREGVGRVETQFVTKDGKKLDILLSSAPIIPGRMEEGLVFTAMDITERKRVEKALKESEERERLKAMEFEAVLEAVPIAVFIAHDAKCEYMTGNQAAYDLVGITPEANPSKSAPESERPSYRTVRDGVELTPEQLPMQLAAFTGKAVFGSRLTIIRADGSVRHSLGNAVPLFGVGGKVRGVIGVFVDITEIKGAEEALLAANAQMEALIQAIPDVVYMKDSQGTHVIVNQAFERLTGLSRSSIIGRTDVEILPLEKAAHCRESDALTATSLSQTRFEETAVAADGRTLYYDTIKAPIISADGTNAGIVGVSRDVTDRKNMENELRESEQRFRAIAESAHDLIYLKSLSLRFTYTNPAMQAYFGESAEKLIGRSLKEWAEKNVAEHLDDSNRRALAGEIIHEEVTLYVNGVPRNLSVVKVPIRNSTGSITSLCGIARDVTEHMQLVEELKRYQEQIRNITDGIGAYLFSAQVSEAGEYLNLMSTSGYGRIHCQSPEDVMNTIQDWLDTVYPDDLSLVMLNMQRVMANEPASYEYRVIRPDGTLRWLRNDVQASADEHGRVNSIRGFAYDITEQKESEEKVLAAERRFHELLDSIQLIVVGTDAQGIVFYANPYFAGMVGRDRDSLVGIRGISGFVPDARKEFAIESSTVDEAQNKQDVEYPIIRFDGEERLVSWSKTLLRDASNNVTGLLSIGIDITEARRAEREIKKTSEIRRALASRILTAQEAERVHIARELHDVLGQVLTGIKMELDWLRMHPESRGSGERILAIAKLADDAINAVRDLAYGLRPPVLDDIGVESALESLVRDVESRSGIKCHTMIHARIEALSPMLSTALYRITQEALTNVIRHSGATEATVLLRRTEDSISLIISDNGIGFDAGVADSSMSLGIAGMRERAALLGGEVAVESRLDGGTTVRASFPLSY